METLYKLVWKSEYGTEVIETDLTRDEARYLRREYGIAYGGIVTIKKQRG